MNLLIIEVSETYPSNLYYRCQTKMLAWNTHVLTQLMRIWCLQDATKDSCTFTIWTSAPKSHLPTLICPPWALTLVLKTNNNYPSVTLRWTQTLQFKICSHFPWATLGASHFLILDKAARQHIWRLWMQSRHHSTLRTPTTSAFWRSKALWSSTTFVICRVGRSTSSIKSSLQCVTSGKKSSEIKR